MVAVVAREGGGLGSGLGVEVVVARAEARDGGGGGALTAGAKVGGAEAALRAVVDHEDACEDSHRHEHLGGVAL